jgi:hypothetical protein
MISDPNADNWLPRKLSRVLSDVIALGIERGTISVETVVHLFLTPSVLTLFLIRSGLRASWAERVTGIDCGTADVLTNPFVAELIHKSFEASLVPTAKHRREQVQQQVLSMCREGALDCCHPSTLEARFWTVAPKDELLAELLRRLVSAFVITPEMKAQLSEAGIPLNTIWATLSSIVARGPVAGESLEQDDAPLPPTRSEVPQPHYRSDDPRQRGGEAATDPVDLTCAEDPSPPPSELSPLTRMSGLPPENQGKK